MQNIINVAEIAAADWNFVEDDFPAAAVQWQYHSARPLNALERLITRPKLSRYRACWQATRALSQPQDVVISHLPRTTHWQSVFMKALGRKQRHLAFSFNFTDLPSASLQQKMIESFSRVNGFVVYSQFEKKLYSDFFQIPPEKIHMLHWAMQTPEVDASFTPPWPDYYCAVGGEGRDYPTLIKAFAQTPHLRLVIVTRPHALGDITLPDNVKAFFNLSNAQFWTVVQKSKALIVTLRNDQTACGHITLVGAMKLGKPIITTFSQGTTDYIHPNLNALVYPPQDPQALAQTITHFESTPTLPPQLSQAALHFAQTHCEPAQWAQFVYEFCRGKLDGK